MIFDLDGVLVDSEIWWDEVRIEFAARHGRTWTHEDQAAVMGQNSRQWARTMQERLRLELDPDRIEREIVDGVVERYRRHGAPLIAGAVEVVRRVARDLPIAVASSAHRDVIDAALAALDLAGVFRTVVSSDDVAEGKPSPDVYLEAARRLGAAPERCLVVEDSLNGVKAGRAAGMTVVLVPNASVPPAPGAHEAASHVAPAIEEILRHLGLALEGEAAPELPGTPGVSRLGRSARYYAAWVFARIVVGAYLRLRVVGTDRVPPGPAVFCFNHQCWADPFIFGAAMPARPRLYFFGPREEDMSRGVRNRLMAWIGTGVPFRPGERGLIEATRRVERIFEAGGRLAIAGEGTIHVGEATLLPLGDGPAFFALHSGVPLIPVALSGNGWIAFGRRVRVTFGEPLLPEGRPDRQTVDELTARLDERLRAMVAGVQDRPAPGPFGRWLTELFNVWPDGRRPDPPPPGRAAGS